MTENAEKTLVFGEYAPGPKAAAMMGISAPHFSRLANQGIIKAIRVNGRLWLCPLSEIDRFRNLPRRKGGHPRSGDSKKAS
jgi:excisionase family DNA binding protein